MQYARHSDLKKEANAQFRRTHAAEVEGSLTLSQIRALKLKMLEVALEQDMEVSTAAVAHTFLEKLVLKRLVHKPNRRLVAATCLLLATKVNDAVKVSYKAVLQVCLDPLASV